MLEMLYNLTCKDVSQSYREACENAVKATSVQTNVEQTSVLVGDKTIKYVEGKAGAKPLAFILFGAKTYREKSLNINLPKAARMNVLDRASVILKKDEGILKIGWDF